MCQVFKLFGFAADVVAEAAVEPAEADANLDAGAGTGAGGRGGFRTGLLVSLTAFLGCWVEYDLSCVKRTLENSACFEPAQSLVPASDIMVLRVTSAKKVDFYLSVEQTPKNRDEKSRGRGPKEGRRTPSL